MFEDENEIENENNETTKKNFYEIKFSNVIQHAKH